MSLSLCLSEYLSEYYLTDGAADINNYITVEKIKGNCSDYIEKLELVDGDTLKVKYYDNIYYVDISILESEGKYSVGNVEAFTEEEYKQ